MLLLLCLTLVCGLATAMTACDGGEESCEQIDTDLDGYCDDCGDPYEIACAHKDTDYNGHCDSCNIEYKVVVDCTFELKDEDGNGIKGIDVVLYRDSTEVKRLTTVDGGTVTATIDAGHYNVNVEGLPEYWTSTAAFSAILVNPDNDTFSYTAKDNTPDGTLEKPYPAINAETGECATLELAAGASASFTALGGAERYLVIRNGSVKVTYGGVDYSAEEGEVRVLLLGGSTNAAILFTVTNTATEATTVTLSFEFPEGTSDNPIAIEALDTAVTAAASAETAVYYSYTATFTGTLCISSETVGNNIAMSNGYTLSEPTMGGESTTIAVTEGDTVKIEISLTYGTPNSDVVFILSQVE